MFNNDLKWLSEWARKEGMTIEYWLVTDKMINPYKRVDIK